MTTSFSGMTRLIIAGIFTLLFSGFIPSTGHAQNCSAYEREMQEYFLAYEPGDMIDLSYLERVRYKCDYPTPKIELIFNYFRSSSSLRSERLTDVEAYEQATYYYDLCARNFSYLVKAGQEDIQFTDKFFERAEGLEAALASLAYDLNYQPQDRRYGELGQSDMWGKKELYPVRERAQNTRGQEDRVGSESFEKKFFYRGNYVRIPSNQNYRPRFENGEAYGWVGTLDDIDPDTYFRYMRDGSVSRGQRVTTDVYYDQPEAMRVAPEYRAQAQPAPVAAPIVQRAPYYLNDDWVEALEKKGYGLKVYVSNRDLLPVYADPGGFGHQIGYLSFGEAVVQIKSQDNKPVQKDGFNYIPVVTSRNQMGWVELSTVIRDGRLAVFKTATRGFVSTNTPESARNSDRNSILFQPGEMVILSGVREDWVKVVSDNRSKEAWLNSTTSLSIDPLDIHVGFQMQQAMKEPSPLDQQNALVRLAQDYPDSELTNVVLARVRELQKQTGFNSFR